MHFQMCVCNIAGAAFLRVVAFSRGKEKELKTLEKNHCLPAILGVVQRGYW